MRSRPPPSPPEPPVRHARLFELLRQQNMSEMTAARLRHRARTRIDKGDIDMMRIVAEQSWMQISDRAPTPTGSAAKPGGHDKFFRAVRA